MDFQAQIILLISGQILTLLVLLATNYLNRRHSQQLLEGQLQTLKRVEHLQEQITKFYGPIHTLLCVNQAVLKVRFDPETKSFTKKVPDELWHDLRDNILIPNNLTIVEIIKSNFHLIEGAEIPTSIISFIIHAEVWARRHKHGFDKMDYLDSFGFPAEFVEYIRKTTEITKREYDALVERRASGIPVLSSK